MFSEHGIVPVVMFHSVGLHDADWAFAHISEPTEAFEAKIHALTRAGYQFIFWNELYEHMAGIRRLSGKSVMLTFDDGYLDNWVHVYPLLRKYGARATIFVSPDFVDPSSGLRPNRYDVDSAENGANRLGAVGFLNWDEMREMEKSGLVDIQSHGLSHTWYFSGPTVREFYRPGQKNLPWMAWNARPDRKPFYMTEDQSSVVSPGTPVYEHEKALICRRYRPPKYLQREMVAFAAECGQWDVPGDGRWQGRLRTEYVKLTEGRDESGVYETESEYRSRVTDELERSKWLIEENLSKRVDYICWPGGGYDRGVTEMAREVGYKAWTLGSQDQSEFRNRPNSDPEQVKRVGSFARYQLPGGAPLGYAGGRYFLSALERHKGSVLHTWLGRAMLGGARMKSLVVGS